MVSNYLRNNKIFIPLIVVYYPLFKYFIFLNNNKGHTFLTSDWLINYNYGFVKRGLPGTIFMSLTKNPELLLDIISGQANPQGKMPFSTPRSVQAVLEQKADLPGFEEPQEQYALFNYDEGLNY